MLISIKLMRFIWCLIIASLSILSVHGQEPCVVNQPTASFTIRRQDGHPGLNLNPTDKAWSKATVQSMSKDCSRKIDYPHIKTSIRGFWTDKDLYLLFECPYTELNLFLPTQNDKKRLGLWDRDVVEMFLGDDWSNIRHYREFEIAPTGDWIDLAIDLDHESYDHSWSSGWETKARIDEGKKVWYAAARIPLSAFRRYQPAGQRWNKMADQLIPD